MQRLLVLVQVRDEVLDSAAVLELHFLSGAALVDQLDAQPRGQERRLAHTLGERVEVEQNLVEDLQVGEKRDRRAGVLGRLALRQLARRRTSLVALRPDVPVAVYLEVEPLRERVDHRHAHAVQAAGHLVATAVAELAAGVQNR